MMRAISEIDRDITANMRELRRRHPISKPFSAEQWQAARDAHPDLDARDHDLYRERAIAQLVRDAKTVDDKRLRTRYLNEIAAKYSVAVEA